MDYDSVIEGTLVFHSPHREAGTEKTACGHKRFVWMSVMNREWALRELGLLPCRNCYSSPSAFDKAMTID